mmetsp:Transcript_11445/g.29235  ORF Transcript_11445/g.29235 Transcript_11445/m.29235 type:complete len:309 (+) Transcript_11445:30-956(+)
MGRESRALPHRSSPAEAAHLTQLSQPSTAAARSAARGLEGRAVPIVLAGLSLTYFWAFASLYVQLPGLYGAEGIVPVDATLSRHTPRLMGRSARRLTWPQVAAEVGRFPSVAAVGAAVGEHTDTVLDVAALAGMALAMLSLVSTSWRVAPVFAALFLLYRSFTLVGSPFLNFQWDALLLEAGALGVVGSPLYCFSGYTPATGEVARWCFRFLVFKLMFQSGVVKLTSGCPTWWNLSALTVHYESQCIPTPAPFHFHHLPRWFHEISVILTYYFEIALPFVYLVKVIQVELLGFGCQVLLMGLIIVTGN